MSGQTLVKLPAAARVVAEWIADAAAQRDTEAYLGRRKSVRFVWPAAVEVLVEPQTSSGEPIFATGVDVSQGGMGLVVRQAIPIGASVLLRYADDGDRCPWVPARVVHSKPAAGGYRAGVEFELEPAY